MITNDLRWMLVIYIALGVLMGISFSLVLNQFIPIPGQLFLFFMIASVFAGSLLGMVNYLVYFYFTKIFIRHVNQVLNSVRNGDLSARTQFRSGGIIGELNRNINKTLVNLEHSQNTILHDDLTRIPNRQALQQRFLNGDESGACALLFIDVNEFKKINDTYGHMTGDEMLKSIAAVLQKIVKKTAQVYRLSGDEFVILQKIQDGESAEELGSRIHHAFESPFCQDGHHIRVSVSIGVCEFEFGHRDFVSILDEADQEMYKAKNMRKVRLQS
ncbi:GGDEF domain-containing protein [Halobacillus trueperi]|uniref:GGDEF domain-containing protein n=1 Tax=Halobacillus trueperi TaxID=156205 RepID=A0A3E0J8E3_9BACI|nr:GGDEF domain-containing protein [Halobacillus trueperi]REJ09059.1 GGDEF domain-containing protein [Halobacillus trueperi]